jgi:hypothetical protein
MHLNTSTKYRVIRSITRGELEARLDWGADFFQNDLYQVLECPAADLLTAERFDLLAKIVYAEHLLRGVRSDFGERLYAEHIRVWNGFSESVPAKSGRSDFIDSYRALITTLKETGFSPQKSLVPIDRYGRILDGAHRVAAGIAAGKSVHVVQTDTAAKDRQVPDYDFRFFAESRSFVPSGLAKYYSDEMARAYCRIRPNARLAVFFPVADRRRDPRALEILGGVGTILYARSFSLNETGAFQFIRHLYHHDARGWIGTARDGFAGARDKATRCFGALGPVRVVLLDPAADADLVDAKKSLRELYEQHDAVHISDTAEELTLVGGFVFNENSIDFFNRARTRTFEQFDTLFHRYGEAVQAAGASREDLCIHGSGPIAAAGLRDCRDLDFLAFGTAAERVVASGLSRRPQDALITPEYADSIIFDPARHFWYFGHKFATLAVVREFKSSRAEIGKDSRDVALIDRVLRPTTRDQVMTWYFSKVGMRQRTVRDGLRFILIHTGLLGLARSIRKTLAKHP